MTTSTACAHTRRLPRYHRGQVCHAYGGKFRGLHGRPSHGSRRASRSPRDATTEVRWISPFCYRIPFMGCSPPPCVLGGPQAPAWRPRRPWPRTSREGTDIGRRHADYAPALGGVDVDEFLQPLGVELRLEASSRWVSTLYSLLPGGGLGGGGRTSSFTISTSPMKIVPHLWHSRVSVLLGGAAARALLAVGQPHRPSFSLAMSPPDHGPGACSGASPRRLWAAHMGRSYQRGHLLNAVPQRFRPLYAAAPTTAQNRSLARGSSSRRPRAVVGPIVTVAVAKPVDVPCPDAEAWRTVLTVAVREDTPGPDAERRITTGWPLGALDPRTTPPS